MTDTLEPRASVTDPVADAIAALTAVARGRRTIGAGTSNERTIPADFGEVACDVLAAVAANVGGVEQLLAGRPGSWEADSVRRLLVGTVGEDEHDLWGYRTAPVRLELDVEDLFVELGLYDLYEEAAAAAADAVEKASAAVFDAVATQQEREEYASITSITSNAFLIEDEDERGRALLLVERLQQIMDAVRQRAEQAGLLGEVDAAQQLADRIDELWEADQLAYRNAFESAAHHALSERDLGHLDVELVPELVAVKVTEPDALSDQIYDDARARTPLPMTGEAPHDGDKKALLDALRAAGLTYADRANREGETASQ